MAKKESGKYDEKFVTVKHHEFTVGLLKVLKICNLIEQPTQEQNDITNRIVAAIIADDGTEEGTAAMGKHLANAFQQSIQYEIDALNASDETLRNYYHKINVAINDMYWGAFNYKPSINLYAMYWCSKSCEPMGMEWNTKRDMK